VQQSYFAKGVGSMSSDDGTPNDDVDDKEDSVNEQNSTEWEGFKLLYKNYVSAIAVIKDTLDVLWKLAPIGLVMPAVLIWSYLKKIGWPQLFPEAVISVPGLVVMIVASCLLTVLLAIQFAVPSIISVCAVGVYEEQNKIVAGGKIRGPLAGLFIGAPAIWLVVFGGLLQFSNLSTSVSFVFSIATMIVFEVYVLWSRWDLFSDPAKSGWFGIVVQAVKMMFMPTLSAMSVSLSLVICLGVFSSDNFSGVTGFFVFLGCAFYSVIGVIPGMAFLLEKIYEKKPFDIFKTTIFIGAIVFYVLWMGAMTLAPVTSTILKSIGAIDEERYVYQVLKSDLVTALQGAGFKVYMVGTSPYSKEQATYFVDSYVRFNFSNVLLLCRDPLSFNKADRASMTNTDVKDRLLIWRAGGYFCVKARTDEVRPLQSLRKP
jgi:hypothetical protein